jgi:hypothetical protein
MTLITDCRDDNARARVTARLASLQPVIHSTTIGVVNDLEAALNVVDQLDAFDGRPGIILVNVAPRNGTKRWGNGAPFGWLKIEDTFIFGTIAGHTFSLLQKVLARKLVINVFDLSEAVRHFDLSEERKRYILSTQFRSFEFLPRVAALILAGAEIPTTEWGQIPDAPRAVVWVDCFGNVKTLILPGEVGFKAGAKAEFRANGKTRHLTCYNRLKDIPDGENGLIIGSSGLWVGNDNRRLLEVVINGGNAAAHFKLKSGDKIEICLS